MSTSDDMDESVLSGLDEVQLSALRCLVLESREHYIRMFFKLRDNSTFIVSQHHRVLHRVFNQVYDGEIKRLIINMPPGYTKTEEAVIAFISGGLAKNNRSKYIHASYSKDLALENSRKVKDTIQLPEYQTLFPMVLRNDTKSAGKWYTEFGGGMLATSVGGQITGFRAGRMEPGFTGALVVDDPLKPSDAYSVPKRTRSNKAYNGTLANRLAHQDIPVIVIMQRLVEDDLTSFLLSGGSGEMWHHLELPVLIGEDDLPVPKTWTHRIPVPTDLPPGPLWPAKHNLQQIEALKTDPYVYSSQFMQRPAPLSGGIFKRQWFQYYTSIPPLRLMMVYSDTASKTEEQNDYSVFILVGLTTDGKLAILDLVRGKWEAPELLTTAESFWNKAKVKRSLTIPGARLMKVEDKSSGIGLIQQLKRKIKGHIAGIPRDKDKIRRAMGCVPEFVKGNILLPSGPTELTDASWVLDYVEEHVKFTPLMTHDHDDQIDPTLDAIEDLLTNGAVGLYKNV